MKACSFAGEFQKKSFCFANSETFRTFAADMKTEKQMAAAAADFAARWEGKGYERGQSQLFWADLLTSVYGVENLPGDRIAESSARKHRWPFREE